MGLLAQSGLQPGRACARLRALKGEHENEDSPLIVCFSRCVVDCASASAQQRASDLARILHSRLPRSTLGVTFTAPITIAWRASTSISGATQTRRARAIRARRLASASTHRPSWPRAAVRCRRFRASGDRRDRPLQSPGVQSAAWRPPLCARLRGAWDFGHRRSVSARRAIHTTGQTRVLVSVFGEF